ncbi:transposase [Reyranella soli]|uniref:transposase n=1 Tax=Reyranella soli TaxID=1230389 RepID=UPI0035A2580B
MPNHVHVVVEPGDGNRLGDIVHSWKSYSANRANTILGRTGPFWHKDFFDRFVRDEGHLARTIDYVENNPVKLGLLAPLVHGPGAQVASEHERAGSARSGRHLSPILPASAARGLARRSGRASAP